MNTHVRYILLINLFSPLLLCAQGEQNIWMVNNVPLGGTRNGIDFTGGSPQLFHFSNPPYNFTGSVSASNAVCNAAGQPLFYTNGKTVYDRTGQVMPDGADLIYPGGGTGYSMPPVIMPVPGQGSRYAIFTHRNGGLYYTLVDMDANNGQGAVMPQYKNVSLNSFAGRDGITMNAKTVSVQGCVGNWLVYRSRYAKEFRAFAVTSAGVQPGPVISEAGLLPVSDYEGNVYQGVLKASPDGRKLAIVAKGAIELFDFDRCSGQVTNPALLTADGDYYYGLCFSPDNSKLYATTIEWPYAGRLYQFDLSLPTAAAVAASKTLVFTSPTYWRWTDIAWVAQADPLGDLKIAPDGKIYISNCYNQSVPCYVGQSVQTPRYTGGYHVINHPNLPGVACNPVENAIWVNTWMGIDLPPDIVLPPEQDTVYGGLRPVTACFCDSVLLQANTPGSCYRWDDGSGQTTRMVREPGIYWVQYTNAHCSLHIDSFEVQFVQLPDIGPAAYSCPNEQKGNVTIIPADNTRFNYTWRNSEGHPIRERETDNGDTLISVTAGRYSVQLTTTSGCDTTLYAEVLPLPLPPVSYEADTIICKGVPLSFTNTSDTPVWTWHFGDSNTAKEQDPQHIYGESGRYKTMLIAENVEGCRDTAVKTIEVKELLLSLSASPSVLNVEESVTLHTSAPEAYRVTAWLPESFFTDQSAFDQYVRIDTTRTFTVTAISDYGCTDTASVLVTTHPLLYLPTAFTPNGDGRNDYFRPAISGGPVTVRTFRIFDRWGRDVWSGQGSSDAVGWDGSCNGVPAQVGTYYYTIEAETHTGQMIRQKGDVMLVR